MGGKLLILKTGKKSYIARRMVADGGGWGCGGGVRRGGFLRGRRGGVSGMRTLRCAILPDNKSDDYRGQNYCALLCEQGTLYYRRTTPRHYVPCV